MTTKVYAAIDPESGHANQYVYEQTHTIEEAEKLFLPRAVKSMTIHEVIQDVFRHYMWELRNGVDLENQQ